MDNCKYTHNNSYSAQYSQTRFMSHCRDCYNTVTLNRVDNKRSPSSRSHIQTVRYHHIQPSSSLLPFLSPSLLFPSPSPPFPSLIFTRDSIYAIARICYGNSICLSVCLYVCPSVCLSHGWISQKRLKLRSRNFHRTVAHPSSFSGVSFIPKF